MHLVFTKSQAQESFTNSSTSQFNDKNEHALFRELIQNALDAAQPNASAEVKISHHTVNTYEMPGLDDLQAALDAAREFWDEDPQTHKIVPRIQYALDENTLDLLVITDNGVGLNKDRMNDILHDGASRKDPSSAGSYGNGHISTFKFSDLLYVLYVGLSEEGTLIQWRCGGDCGCADLI